MRLLVVNPNTTASMTALVEEHARAVAGPGVLVDAVNPAFGPAAIQTREDEERAVPGLLAEVRAGAAAAYDGFVVACFGDPGVEEARATVPGPVLGIAEAAMRTAGYLGEAFSVVTTVPAAVRPTWDLARRYGLSGHCAGVHASGVPVLALAEASSLDAVTAVAAAALEADASDVLVLGCAGMAAYVAPLRARLGVPVVDGVAAATVTVEGLVRLAGGSVSVRAEEAPRARVNSG